MSISLLLFRLIERITEMKYIVLVAAALPLARAFWGKETFDVFFSRPKVYTYTDGMLYLSLGTRCRAPRCRIDAQQSAQTASWTATFGTTRRTASRPPTWARSGRPTPTLTCA